jgi:hypothetical protein
VYQRNFWVCDKQKGGCLTDIVIGMEARDDQQFLELVRDRLAHFPRLAHASDQIPTCNC